MERVASLLLLLLLILVHSCDSVIFTPIKAFIEKISSSEFICWRYWINIFLFKFDNYFNNIFIYIHIYNCCNYTFFYTLYYKKYITIINSETLIKIHFFDLLIVTHGYCKFFSETFFLSIIYILSTFEFFLSSNLNFQIFHSIMLKHLYK